jgi:outer membrane usher protein
VLGPSRLAQAAAHLAVAALAILCVTLAPRPAAAVTETLQLEVVVNGYSTGKVGEFELRDGALFARPQELRDVGFRVSETEDPQQEGMIALSVLPGLTSRFDKATQTLYVTAETDRLLPILLRSGANTVGAVHVESGTGMTFNYDVTGALAGGQTLASGLFDLRAFSPWGVASSSALAYAGGGLRDGRSYSAVRLDSTYVYSDPQSLRRYRAGDFITGGLSWTRPVRLGGVQVNSDFSMRPDLVTFPLPSVSGSVAVPSTVDVLVDGAQLLSRDIQPGPFQAPQLPVITGAGTIAVTVTDALGRQVTTSLPFYASSALLAPGLQSYSAEVGAVRRNWGLVSNDYGDLAASATYRRGLSSDVTVEAHAEGVSGQLMAGGGVVMNVANLGVVDLAAAASTALGRTGAQVSVGAQRIGRVFSLGASATLATHAFSDIAAMSGDPVPRLQLNANAGLSFGRWGSLGIAYTGVDRDQAPAPISFFAPPGRFGSQNTPLPGDVVSGAGPESFFQPSQHAHIVSASYSVTFHDVSLSVNGFRDFASGGSTGVSLGLTIPFGRRSSASASVGAGSGGRTAQVQVEQSATSIGELGYQAYVAGGPVTHAFAELQYMSPWALLSVGADRTGGQTTLRAEGRGAVSFMDGGLFASNTVNDSFAVVDTSGAAGIRVLYENRLVGRTDAAGRLLLPDLRAFDLNHISIDPTDVAVDATLPTASKEVRPQDRSGVLVHFPVKISHAALVSLADETGHPLPVGSVATLAATSVAAPVGYDGEAYVEGLSPRNNRLAVQRPSGERCQVVFDYQAAAGEIPRIGPLTCRGNNP